MVPETPSIDPVRTAPISDRIAQCRQLLARQQVEWKQAEAKYRIDHTRTSSDSVYSRYLFCIRQTKKNSPYAHKLLKI